MRNAECGVRVGCGTRTRGLALIVSLALLPSARAFVQEVGAPPVRLLLAVDPSLTDVRDGVRLGVDEMQRTASLLGRELEVLWTDSGPPAAVPTTFGGRTAAGLLVATRGDLDVAQLPPLGVPVLALSPVRGAAASVPRWVFQLRAERPGTEWRENLSRFGAGELNERYRRRTGRGMTADAWVGWVAVKVIVEAALRAEITQPHALVDALRALEFDAHKGVPLHFDEHGRLVQPTY
jgi:hypothetical protein